MLKKDKVFIIAEAGSNWKTASCRQDLKQAKALIDAASQAGADAVKFQTFRADTVYVPNAGSSDYLSKNGIRKSIHDIFREMSMPYEMLPRLAKHCHSKKIHFMSSFFSEKDFEAVNPFVRIHKIASYEISHPHLIALAARSKKTLILSTGASTLQDIDWAVRVFRKSGGRNLCLMQCTAKYPAPLSTMNLKVIPMLVRRYRVPVGLSDHSLDPIVAPVAAVALGARMIEKHFTLSRSLAGPDHAFAVVPSELKTMVQAIRGCESAVGDGKKRVLSVEKELRAYAQRAVQATTDIQKGDTLLEGKNISVLRPGKQPQGTHPRFLSRIEGARASRFIRAGAGIKQGDYSRA